MKKMNNKVDLQLNIDFIDNKPLVYTKPSKDFDKAEHFNLIFNNSHCHIAKQDLYDCMEIIYSVMEWCQENLKIS